MSYACVFFYRERNLQCSDSCQKKWIPRRKWPSGTQHGRIHRYTLKFDFRDHAGSLQHRTEGYLLFWNSCCYEHRHIQWGKSWICKTQIHCGLQWHQVDNPIKGRMKLIKPLFYCYILICVMGCNQIEKSKCRSWGNCTSYLVKTKASGIIVSVLLFK